MRTPDASNADCRSAGVAASSREGSLPARGNYPNAPNPSRGHDSRMRGIPRPAHRGQMIGIAHLCIVARGEVAGAPSTRDCGDVEYPGSELKPRCGRVGTRWGSRMAIAVEER